MKHLYCAACGERYPGEGVRQVYARTAIERAELARVIRGYARMPSLEQRLVYVNRQPVPLEPDRYDCDLCGAPIRPGEPAVAVTVWLEDRPEPKAWEWQFITPAQVAS